MRIQIRDVSFAYKGQPVLKGVTADIDSNSMTCLVGANGAGKTTLLRILMGHLKPTSGRVAMVDGDTSISSPQEMAGRQAILPQGIQDPPHLTVGELVSLGRFRPRNGLGWRLGASDRVVVDDCIRRCHITHLVNRVFKELSGGEKQRAWLAFCLAQEKEFLILDESLHGIDFFARRTFFGVLSDLASDGKGVLLTTHDLDMAGLFANRLLVLKDGALHYDGPPRQDLPDLITRATGSTAPL